MSLAIDVDTVMSVMLSGQWLDIVPGSFDLDSYEFTHQGTVLHPDATTAALVGFRFEVTDPVRTTVEVLGPLSAIEAISSGPMAERAGSRASSPVDAMARLPPGSPVHDIAVAIADAANKAAVPEPVQRRTTRTTVPQRRRRP